jgi:hypothetical protein
MVAKFLQQWHVHNTSGRRLRLGWPEYSHLSAPRHQRLRIAERSRSVLADARFRQLSGVGPGRQIQFGLKYLL